MSSAVEAITPTSTSGRQRFAGTHMPNVAKKPRKNARTAIPDGLQPVPSVPASTGPISRG